MAALRVTLIALLTVGVALAGLVAPGAPAWAQASGKAADKAAKAADAACAAQPAPSRQYVATTSARLRRSPRADAATVATLPIGTALQVECRVSGWARAGSGDPPATGWVREDLLQADMPTLEALISAHGRAKAGERKALAERAVALAPFDARSHQLMIETLAARRDRKGAQQASALRDRMVNPKGEQLGKEPWTLFAVEDGMVNAVAIIEGPDRFRDASTWTPPGTRGAPDTSPFLLPWRGLHFYRRGGADGVVQVLQAPAAEAIGFFSPVRHPPATAREATLQGLASNRVVTSAEAPVAAAPSRSERSHLDRALRAALKRERVPAKAISALFAAGPNDERGGVERHVLAASGKPILLITANWRLPAPAADQEPPLLDAVLLMEADGKGNYKVTHRLVQKTVGDAIAHHDFVDQLDLDQDGVAELVFRVGHYEGHDYEIWRCDGEAWKTVFQGAYTGV
ncbi:SH3 domain-containing protein [Agrilutibacter solisilvae]|uniref:SH3 domain-containing protein n=1 Tax=Agrilutibacter solisilvae TaxID=2763317 RepID=A0A975AS73_9GAMM|nr:SH3 domain-containing protein [Lysobacter solisilvae]QSX78619.1 hypothetical protein I8J32_001360 [Lysobacter solisilvae]